MAPSSRAALLHWNSSKLPLLDGDAVGFGGTDDCSNSLGGMPSAGSTRIMVSEYYDYIIEVVTLLSPFSSRTLPLYYS